jgi:hypothetical protein
MIMQSFILSLKFYGKYHFHSEINPSWRHAPSQFASIHIARRTESIFFFCYGLLSNYIEIFFQDKSFTYIYIYIYIIYHVNNKISIQIHNIKYKKIKFKVHKTKTKK